jgi:hypothetical protein
MDHKILKYIVFRLEKYWLQHCKYRLESILKFYLCKFDKYKCSVLEYKIRLLQRRAFCRKLPFRVSTAHALNCFYSDV